LCPQRPQIGIWAAQNNLKLNRGKTKEMVITGRGKRGKSANLPAPCPGIERVSSICILGVTDNDQLSAADHVNSLLASSKSLLYVLRVLRVHGIPDVSLQEVFRATLLAKMTYACPAWHGMYSAGDHVKLESLVNRCRRLGYCCRDETTQSELYSEANDRYVQWCRDQPGTCTSPVSNGTRANLQSPPPAAWKQNSTHKNSITY